MERRGGFLADTSSNHLPPPERAPILEHLERLGLEKFREEYGIETPLTDDGVVDFDTLITETRGLVDEDYRWQAPFFDEHHLQWEAHKYSPEAHNGDTLPHRFRDLPTRKLWVPRQFHNFIHTVTIEPPVPDRSIMREHVDTFRRHRYIYLLAQEAIGISERQARSIYYPRLERAIDPRTRRAYNPDELEQRRQEFITRLESSFEKAREPDLTELSILQLVENKPIEEVLPSIRKRLGVAAVCQSKKRKARPVSLPLELAA